MIRKATEQDVDQLYDLIDMYAQQGIMLSRSKASLLQQIASFMIAEHNGKLVGCGALIQLGPELVEIRSLGISKSYKGQGIGSQLLISLIYEAKQQNFKKVMALTYEVAFFQRNGFEIVPKSIFPEKVWKDCMNCKKQYACDEIAVLKQLD
jgi:amino-acid N-acetyltransferase